jgi:hypothetical protein
MECHSKIRFQGGSEQQSVRIPPPLFNMSYYYTRMMTFYEDDMLPFLLTDILIFSRE